MERELPLPVGNPRALMGGDAARARLTRPGLIWWRTDSRKVVEYDETGKAVWSANVPGAWSAVRLRNGNTLVCGKGAQEIDPQGKTVWEFSSAAVPDYKFNSWQIATRLPNGKHADESLRTRGRTRRSIRNRASAGVGGHAG